MQHEQQHYVNGTWVAPLQPTLLDVISPSAEEPFTRIAVGGPANVDRAVAAARVAFPAFARTTRTQRLDLLRAILSEYEKRRQDIADTLSQEMGAPLKSALNSLDDANEHDLVLGDQQIQRLAAVDPGILDLVDQDDRRCGQQRGIRDHQRPRLPAAELGHRHVRTEPLAGERVGDGDDALDHAVLRIDLPAACVHRQEGADGQVDDEIHVLRDLRHQLAVRSELLRRRRRGAVQQDLPPARRVALRQAFHIRQQPALSGPGRADDADDFAGPDHQVRMVRLAGLAAPAADGDAADGRGRRGRRRDIQQLPQMRGKLLAVQAHVVQRGIGHIGKPFHGRAVWRQVRQSQTAKKGGEARTDAGVAAGATTAGGAAAIHRTLIGAVGGTGRSALPSGRRRIRARWLSATTAITPTRRQRSVRRHPASASGMRARQTAPSIRAGSMSGRPENRFPVPVRRMTDAGTRAWTRSVQKRLRPHSARRRQSG